MWSSGLLHTSSFVAGTGARNCSFLIVCVMIVLVCWFTCVCVCVSVYAQGFMCAHTTSKNTHTHCPAHTVQARHTHDATSASISHVSVCPPKQAVVLKLLIIYARAEIASPSFTTSNVNVFIGKLWIFFSFKKKRKKNPLQNSSGFCCCVTISTPRNRDRGCSRWCLGLLSDLFTRFLCLINTMFNAVKVLVIHIFMVFVSLLICTVVCVCVCNQLKDLIIQSDPTVQTIKSTHL